VFFWGTTNDDEYNSDVTGASRWWPIEVGIKHPIDIEGFLAVRDQLYAEAIVAFKAGEKWWLEDAEERALAADEMELRRHQDVWETPISDWLSIRDEATTYEALHALPRGSDHEPDDIKLTRSDEMRMSQVFRALGWRKRRTGEGPEKATGADGRKHRLYVRGARATPRNSFKVEMQTQTISMEDFL
jgi:predicted P-loop ATPase